MLAKFVLFPVAEDHHILRLRQQRMDETHGPEQRVRQNDRRVELLYEFQPPASPIDVPSYEFASLPVHRASDELALYKTSFASRSFNGEKAVDDIDGFVESRLRRELVKPYGHGGVYAKRRFAIESIRSRTMSNKFSSVAPAGLSFVRNSHS